MTVRIIPRLDMMGPNTSDTSNIVAFVEARNGPQHTLTGFYLSLPYWRSCAASTFWTK